MFFGIEFYGAARGGEKYLLFPEIVFIVSRISYAFTCIRVYIDIGIYVMYIERENVSFSRYTTKTIIHIERGNSYRYRIAMRFMIMYCTTPMHRIIRTLYGYRWIFFIFNMKMCILNCHLEPTGNKNCFSPFVIKYKLNYLKSVQKTKWLGISWKRPIPSGAKYRYIYLSKNGTGPSVHAYLLKKPK